MRTVFAFAYRWLFTTAFLVSLLALTLAAAGVVPMAGVWRVLAVPAYAAATVAAVVVYAPVHAVMRLVGLAEAGAPPPAWVAVLWLPLAPLPFILADLYRRVWR